VGNEHTGKGEGRGRDAPSLVRVGSGCRCYPLFCRCHCPRLPGGALATSVAFPLRQHTAAHTAATRMWEEDRGQEMYKAKLSVLPHPLSWPECEWSARTAPGCFEKRRQAGHRHHPRECSSHSMRCSAQIRDPLSFLLASIPACLSEARELPLSPLPSLRLQKAEGRRHAPFHSHVAQLRTGGQTTGILQLAEKCAQVRQRRCGAQQAAQTQRSRTSPLRSVAPFVFRLLKSRS